MGYAVQTDRDFEIVVTEDGMDPANIEVVERMRDKTGLTISHLSQPDEGFRKAVALNRGIEKASGDYLIFTDDDCIPRNDLVATHRKYAKPGQYIVGAYNRLPVSVSSKVTVKSVENQRAFSLPWLMTRGFFPTRGFLRMIVPKSVGTLLDMRGPLQPGRFPGGHSSCYRNDALAVGGFNERMTYGLEDREFGTRLCNYGLKGKRIKNSTFMLHLEHSRPYHNKKQFAENRKILDETVRSGRIVSAHLDAKT